MRSADVLPCNDEATANVQFSVADPGAKCGHHSCGVCTEPPQPTMTFLRAPDIQPGRSMKAYPGYRQSVER